MNNNVIEKYKMALHVIAFFFSIGIWAISVYFSATGFGIKVDHLAWMGWILAGLVTLLELVINRDGLSLNPTLLFTCVLAYIYGVYTNLAGLMYATGTSQNDVMAVGLVVLLALILEILPEALLIWSFAGPQGDDLLGKVFGGGSVGNFFQKEKSGGFASETASPPSFKGAHFFDNKDKH